MNKRKATYLIGDIIGISLAAIIFIIPFVFMLMNSLKDRREANLLKMTLPETWLFENYREVLAQGNHILITAFKNSGLLTVGSVIGLVLVGSLAGYVLQRRKGKKMQLINWLFLSGLMVPPAVMPTIWLMQGIGIYKTMHGMVLVEIALHIPFTVMLYRGFMCSIPIEIEEAGYIDGCSPIKMFSSIVFPLLKPVSASVIILNAVTVFNDFTNPLYFLPGRDNVTVQLTLYSFMGQYASSYNLLFANVIVITLPMLLLFIIFNRRIVDGMVSGAVKG